MNTKTYLWHILNDFQRLCSTASLDNLIADAGAISPIFKIIEKVGSFNMIICDIVKESHQKTIWPNYS